MTFTFPCREAVLILSPRAACMKGVERIIFFKEEIFSPQKCVPWRQKDSDSYVASLLNRHEKRARSMPQEM